MEGYGIEEWRAYTERLGFAKTEDAEQDYLQELLLFWLFKGKLADMLVFRGGTSISKLYGSGRFSEDLDFVFSSRENESDIEQAINSAIKGISMQYAVDVTMKKYRNMLKYMLKVRGPIYMISRSRQAVQTISVDINLFERPLLNPKRISRIPIYNDIAPYLLNSMEIIELLSDKIKAMMERNTPVARDLYDAWFLCAKYSIKPDLKLVEEKMKLYGKSEKESFDLGELKKRIESIKKIWHAEMSRLMKNPPSYAQVSEYFLNVIY